MDNIQNTFDILLGMSIKERHDNPHKFQYIRVINDDLNYKNYIEMIDEVTNFFGVKYRIEPENWNFRSFPYLGIKIDTARDSDGAFKFKDGLKLVGFAHRNNPIKAELDITIDQLRYINDRIADEPKVNLIRTKLFIELDQII